jgi:hypothetical protein
MDWVLGVGDPTNRRLFGGNDGAVNVMFDTPVFQRMAWRAYQDAVSGPLTSAQYQPQFTARSAALAFNGVTGISSPNIIGSYLNGRRTYLNTQITASDAKAFAITSNGGNNFTSTTPVAVIDGTAPFATAAIEVNGTPMPLEWTSPQIFRIRVPLVGVTNVLNLVAVRADGTPLPGMNKSVTVRYTGVIQQVADYVGINEIHYNPLEPGASFVEIFNRSLSTSFDLSGSRLNGLDYSFPDGSVIPPATYWVLVRDRAAFVLANGSGVRVLDEFAGSLDNGGERLSLVRGTGTNEVVMSEVRYDNALPWPALADGLGSSLQRIDASQSSWRVGNWMAAETNAVNRVTPGKINAGPGSLASVPPLWINEVLPANIKGPRDNAGDRDPYVEIYNTGASALDLGGLYLTDNWTNQLKWSFPLGSVVPAGGFLTVWCDGEEGESASGAVHTSFRLSPTNGVVALVRNEGGASGTTVLDYLNWRSLPADRSLGLVPDGVARSAQGLFYPTPGATNDASFPDFRVIINELMAQNTRTVQDPADGDYDDWIELYNGGTNTVDLSGFYLTDRLTNSVSAMFRIPAGYPIPAGGFLRIWADNETGQNKSGTGELHVNFSLSREGEQVGLFDPRGILVDEITFGAQTNDVSLGRFPDGGPVPLYSMEVPTPGSANVLAGGNRPPVFTPVMPMSSPEQTQIAFTVNAVDSDEGQTVTYALGADAPPGAVIDSKTGRFQWLPSENDGPGAYSFLVRALDNGSPVRTGLVRVQINVTEVNLTPNPLAEVTLEVKESVEFVTQLEATDPDRPAQVLTFEAEGILPVGFVLSSKGQITWTPDESLGGTTQTVAYRVSDDGVPSRSVSGVLRIRVLEINNSPIFETVVSQKLVEGTPWSLALKAVDPEGLPVRFQIDGPAPDGFVLNPQTGAVSWTPTEAQGPASVVVLLRAVDGSSDALSVVRELLLEVAEVNQPPVLATIAPVTVEEGRSVSVVASATDPDQPAQNLRFTLEPGAPNGASIDPVSGLFQWTADDDTGAVTQAITVRVTDDGPGNLSATQRFEITVRPRFKVVFSEILRRSSPVGAEFIELFNRSSKTTWDLSGLRLTGSNLSFVFPSGSAVAPGARAMVVRSQAGISTVFGVIPRILGEWNGTLGSVADSLRLVQPTNGGTPETVLDRVDYDSVAPWPSSALGTNQSLQLIDARQDRNRPGNWTVATTFQGSRTVLGFTDTWKYFQDGAPAGGTNWLTPAFNDAAWPSGGGLLHVESAALATNKTTTLTLGQLAYYFRRKVTIPALTAGVSVQFRVMLDDGYVLWVNGRKAHFLGMDDAVVTHETPANRTVGDAAIEGPFTLPSEFLVPGENTFAVEVHQSNLSSSDVVFGLEMTLEGGGSVSATPGAANTVSSVLPEFPTLRINEVLPRNVLGLRDLSGTAEPWLELINTGDAPVSLDGLFLTDMVDGSVPWGFPPAASIPPGGFRVVFVDGDTLQNTTAEWHTSFRLPSSPGTPFQIQLGRNIGGIPQAVDVFRGMVDAANDRSWALQIDGDPATGSLGTPTPGAVNRAVSAPRLELSGFMADSTLKLVLRGSLGRRYRLERGGVLGTWSPIQEVSVSAESTMLSDPGSEGSASRFYRVVDITPP